MRWPTVLIAIAALLGAIPLAAADKAAFIVGTYATAEGCEKLAALQSGTARNVATVPETLDTDGFHGWEGGCTFSRISEKKPGREFVAEMTCLEAAEEWQETDTFVLEPESDRITVTVDGKSSTYVRCAN